MLFSILPARMCFFYVKALIVGYKLRDICVTKRDAIGFKGNRSAFICFDFYEKGCSIS